MMKNKYFLQDIEQARVWYGEARNTTGKLLLDHVTDVAQVIVSLQMRFGEIDKDEMATMYRIALAHDALEDTSLTIQGLRDVWGDSVADAVDSLSNKKGDTDFSDYIEVLANKSSEVVKLVKLADILANVQNSVTQRQTIETQWIRNFWLPLLIKYRKILFHLKYIRFPLSAHWMVVEINRLIVELEELTKTT